MNPYTLSFSVDHQRITASVPTTPVADTRHYLRACFSFDSTWDDLSRMGVFIGLRTGMNVSAGRSAHTVCTVELDADNACLIPAEVLTADHALLQVGAIGYSADGQTRLTTDTYTVKQDTSCFIPHGTPNPPAPDLYADMMRTAAEAHALAEELAANAAAGVYNGQDGRSGLLPLVRVSVSGGLCTLPANRLTVIEALPDDTIFVLGPAEEGFDNEWAVQIRQGPTARMVVLPTVRWGLGIAPTFAANTTTVCRLYSVGDILCGEWVAV